MQKLSFYILKNAWLTMASMMRLINILCLGNIGQTLSRHWPDMSAYILCTEPRDRNFKNLRAYLMHKDGALPRVLLPKKEFHNISGCDLNNEVSKWLLDLENKEILHKFLF